MASHQITFVSSAASLKEPQISPCSIVIVGHLRQYICPNVYYNTVVLLELNVVPTSLVRREVTVMVTDWHDDAAE